jgi:hypothetical protein
MTAHRLGVARETMRQLGGILRHRVLRYEKGPPSPAGQGGWLVALCYSAAVACSSATTGSFSVADSVSAMAVS